MSKVFHVYKITNTENGKLYIGITQKGYKRRFLDHLWQSRKSRKSCRALYAAINKYGENSFKVDLIETCKNRDELNEREIFWIKELNTLSPNGYNLTKGGDAGVMSDETKAIMSERMKGIKPDEKVYQAMLKARLDPVREARRLNNLRIAMNRPEVRLATSERQKGVKKSLSHTIAIRKAIASRIKCIETGVEFDTVSSAAEWIRGTTEYKASTGKICRALKRSDYTAYGYHWERLSESARNSRVHD